MATGSSHNGQRSDEAARAYFAAARTSPAVLHAVEDLLSTLQDGAPLLREMRASLGGKGTEEERLLVLSALTAMGVLVREGGDWAVQRPVLAATDGFRAGIRATVALMPSTATESVRLVSSFPDSLAPELRAALRDRSTDLTAALIDLCAGASNEILLAAPYWDEETVTGIEPILRRRLESGVTVKVLGRSVAPQDPSGAPLAELRNRLRGVAGFQAYSWYEVDPDELWGARTFHFKAAVIDRGRRCYLGSANFTSAGLRSRFELGVILSGVHARQLHEVLSIALALAERHS